MGVGILRRLVRIWLGFLVGDVLDTPLDGSAVVSGDQDNGSGIFAAGELLVIFFPAGDVEAMNQAHSFP